ncbi:hypothetical protein EW026_g7250 [Hermanssonia centrifuga]|uniref:NADH:flavin oxidoreductase/NADH oxidase N-terminal domain-containing protein n=1 Tax=Hermanssonia centrifuga TaxID=98765 RepID=A0A4V3X9H8_9APHY|nr:hypothetical protein EW026_g7250 [Hermanssonia centrifuga]
MSTSALFQPTQVGDLKLDHRIVLAPLTRNRANSEHVHGDMAVEYYSQRASVKGTLLIAEAVPQAGGRPNVPGIWSEEQINAWKRITDAVHEKGSFIFAQLRAYGRSADPKELAKEDPPFPLVSASDIPLSGNSTPRPLTLPEIRTYIDWYTNAALNAIQAGFDGVELHGANGYLIDQFTSDASNRRTDEYGGSVENRCRFALEILDSVTGAIGEKRTAIRLSPWSTFQEMRMKEPKPTFQYLVSQLKDRYSSLAYLHVIESGIHGAAGGAALQAEVNSIFLDDFVSAGGYTRQSAIETAETKGDLIAFGRPFIGNPDLPLRLRKDLPLIVADRNCYYAYEDPHGYIDFPFAEVDSKSEGNN